MVDFPYIYIYTRNAWALPRRCSVEGPHSQSNLVATLHSIGKINSGIREHKKKITPIKLYIQLRKSTKVIGNIKSHPRLTLHSIGKINKGIRKYYNPTPLHFTPNWEDQQSY